MPRATRPGPNTRSEAVLESSARSTPHRPTSPLVLPGITFGLAALVYFSTLGFRPSLNLMIAGHLMVTMPFILRTTTASLSQLDPALLDSSQSLGASWFYTLRRQPSGAWRLSAAGSGP